jgi:hypothetical protein
MFADLPLELIIKSRNTTICGRRRHQVAAVNHCLAALDPAHIREVVVFSSSAAVTNCFTTQLKIRYALFDMDCLIKLQARGCMDKIARRRQTVIVLNNLGHDRTWHDFPEIVKLFTSPPSENLILMNCVRKMDDAPLILCSSLFVFYPSSPMHSDLAPIFEQIMPDVMFTKLVEICSSLKPHEGLACARPLYFKKVPYMFVLRGEPVADVIPKLRSDQDPVVKSVEIVARSGPNLQMFHFFRTVIDEACALDDTLTPLRQDFDVLLRKHGWRPAPPLPTPAFVPQQHFGQHGCSVDIYGGAKSGRSNLALAVLSFYPALEMTAGLFGHGAEPLQAHVPAACTFKNSATFFKYANKPESHMRTTVACVLDGMVVSEQSSEWHKAKLCARASNKLIVSVNSSNLRGLHSADIICVLKAPSTLSNLRYWAEIIPDMSVEQLTDIMEGLYVYDAIVYVKSGGLYVWKSAGAPCNTRAQGAGSTLYKQIGVLLDSAEKTSAAELMTLVYKAACL